VVFGLDCVGPGVEAQSKALRDGEVLLLENVRFHPEEEKNDEAFASSLRHFVTGSSFAMRSVRAPRACFPWSESQNLFVKPRLDC